MKVIRKWKQVCLETYEGEVIGIETQEYPMQAQNEHILELRLKPGWYWMDEGGITDTNVVKRVRIMYEIRETFWDKIKRRL